MKEKRGWRALYYDASLVLDWKGTTTLGLRPGEEPRDGVSTMYNVGQDTRFCPGGDKDSYMYGSASRATTTGRARRGPRRSRPRPPSSSIWSARS